MPRLDEDRIVQLFASALNVEDLDDVAILKAGGRRFAMKCDMLVKSTDVPPGMKPQQVARKSIVSCASDFACKGIKPLAAMVALGLPRDIDNKYLNGLAGGFAAASRQFGVKIIGGDTNESSELVIDCSMIGLVDGRIPKRSDAMGGDIVVTSGPFGLPPSGLKILLEGARASESFRKSALSSVMNPKPAQKFGALLARYFSSSMDSSDGLALSLYSIAQQSGVDISLHTLPAARGLSEFASANGTDENSLIFYGGEEYQIVATIPSARISLVQRIANANNLDLRVIGSATEGTGKVYNKKSLVDRRGYRHFQSNPLPR
jgi:thiamine-monophosphate kinase